MIIPRIHTSGPLAFWPVSDTDSNGLGSQPDLDLNPASVTYKMSNLGQVI